MMATCRLGSSGPSTVGHNWTIFHSTAGPALAARDGAVMSASAGPAWHADGAVNWSVNWFACLRSAVHFRHAHLLVLRIETAQVR